MYYAHVLRLLPSLMMLCYSGVMAYRIDANHRSYMIMIDAGSSGSRIRIYGLDPGARTNVKHAPPRVKQTYSFKVKPGISSYESNISGLDQHIQRLIRKAKEELDPQFYSSTPLYLMATAGNSILSYKSNILYFEYKRVTISIRCTVNYVIIK